MNLQTHAADDVAQESVARAHGRYGDMVLDWIERAADQAAARAVAPLTPAAWPRARLETRQRLLEALGLAPLPARTTGSEARLIGRLERDDYVVERLVFEPRPHFLMPMHLYLPRRGDVPAPAVLYSPGHWMIHGKTEPDIQACCIGLAKLGFVVLVFDPIGQGERGASFEDHARRDLLLLGQSQEGLMAWESMRAIDYLLSRPEVDGNRIGMTGASGGGLNTVYTCAVDERIAVAIPVCYVTSFGRFLRAMRGLNWNNQNDLCNQVPNVIRDADMAGLCGLIHPRPLLVVNGTLDPQFPVDGAREVVAQLRGIYDAIDPERLRLAAIEADHGYSQPMREAAYGWFRKWLQGEGDGGPISEPPHTTEPVDATELRCFIGTPAIRSGPAIRLLAHALSEKHHAAWAKPTDAQAWESWLLTLRRGLIARLDGIDGCEARAIPVGHVEPGGPRERHLLEPEAGIVTPSVVFRGASQPRGIVVYVCDEGKLSGPGPDLVSRMLEEDNLILVVDPRGLGETVPLPPPRQTVATLEGTLEYRATRPDDTLEFEVATDCLMLGRALFGQQLGDLLHAVRYAQGLASEAPVVVVGSGPIASLLAVYAGALCDAISGVLADRLLPSYHLLIEEDAQLFPITAYVFGILGTADIPQVAAALAPRRLIVTRPTGARLEALEVDAAGDLLSWTTRAFRLLGAPVPAISLSAPIDHVTELLAAGRTDQPRLRATEQPAGEHGLP
jgi:hypothetical protein